MLNPRLFSRLSSPLLAVAATFAAAASGADSFEPLYVLHQSPGSTANAPDMKIRGEVPNDGFGSHLMTADLDGDGKQDTIGAAPNADVNGLSRIDAGAVYVWLGKHAVTPLRDAGGGGSGAKPDVTIMGGDSNDLLGTAVVVGDINGDGRTDLILGAPGASGPSNARAGAGEVYVVYGRATFPATLDMGVQGNAGANLVLYGGTAGDRLSLSGLKIGDVNKDGIHDIVTSAPLADGPSDARADCGEIYVVHGRRVPSLFPATLDMGLSGTTGANLLIYGGLSTDSDLLTEGGALAVGDINGDGSADIIAGAARADGPAEGRANSGEVYVVLGRPAVASVVDLSAPQGDGCVIFGGSAGDGLSLNGGLTVADVNGDGITDVLAGAPLADGPAEGRTDSGEVYVILGRGALPVSLDMSVSGASGASVILYGATAGDNLSADNALIGGDINGDGVADLIVGAMNADGPAEARSQAGEAYLVFGRRSPAAFPGTLDLALQGATGANVTVYGVAANYGLTGDAVVGAPALALGDVTGDGVTDLLLAAPTSRGGRGDAFLLYGRSTFPATMDLSVAGSTGADVTLQAEIGLGMGSRALAAGDINNDGTADIIVSPTSSADAIGGLGYVVFGTAPQLEVEEPAGTPVADGDTKDFGDALAGRLITKVFTIKNAGGGTLRNFRFTIDGAHASQFAIAVPPAASVASGGTTTFTVRFAPSGTGARTATVHLSSNDLATSPFDIVVTGTAVAMPVVKTIAVTKGSVVFDGAELNGSVDAKGTTWDVFFDYGTTTSYGASVAAVPDTVSGTGATAVAKTLTGLLAHTKYNFRVRATHPTLGNVTGANMSFTTSNHTPTPGDDNFTVLPGAKVTLNVLANDTDPDSDPLTIASSKAPLPAKSGTVTKSGNTLVFTASSTFSGASFTYVVKDAFGGSAQATVNLALGTIALTPPGPVTVPSAGVTYPVDIDATGSWSVIESLPWAAVDTTSGTGDDTINVTLQPNTGKAARSGTIFIGGAAHMITQDGVLIPSISMGAVPDAIVSGDFVLDITTVNPPVTYKVTKMPPGLTISNATGRISGKPTTPDTYNVSVQASNAAGKSNVLTFDIVVEALDAEHVGTFHGMIARNADLNGGLGSRIELTTTNKGSYSGKIVTGATSTAIKGALDSDPADSDHPEINLSIPRKTGGPMQLSLTLDKATDSLAGALTSNSGANTASVEAWRNTWSATNLASAYTSLHTFHLKQPDTADLTRPQGYGFGSFKAAEKTGAISVAGKLADNSGFTTSTFIGPDGQVLVYQSLYGNKGSFFGKLIVTTGATVNDTEITGSPSWFKPAPLPASKDTVYRAGFGPFDLTAEGGTFIPPTAGNVIMGFDNADNKARLDFEHDALTPAEEPDIIFSIRNTNPKGLTNKVTLPTFASGNNPLKVTMPTLNTGTGAFAGGFTIPGATAAKNRPGTYAGMAVRVGGVYQGSGFFLVAQAPVGSETVATAPKVSGTALLLKNP